MEEVAELKKKLKELDKFIKSPEYVGGDFPEKQRIAKQYSIMNGYLNILGERINNFVI